MATTTNFGWETPDDTDLVKDGAAAIRTLGQSIDTSMMDLEGGTTGQVLSKASNTDMDFTWVTSDDANAIQNAIVDAKGDLITATAADTPARLAVGTNGHVLTADSTQATGIKWAAAAGGGKVLQVVAATTSTSVTNSTITYADSGLSVTITPSSASSKVLVMVTQNGLMKSAASSNNAIFMRLMRDATQVAEFFETGLYTDTALLITGFSGALTLLDSPATTSATTYKTQFRNRVASAEVRTQSNNALSSIVALEIGA